MANYRKVLLNIDHNIGKKDIRKLKFLCMSFVQRSTASSADKGIDLFEALLYKELITEDDFSFLYRMLQKIDRNDLCSLIKQESHIRVDSALDYLNSVDFQLHEILFAISEQMSPEDVNSLRFLYQVRPNKDIKFGYDLFNTLKDSDMLGLDKLETLIENLNDIERKDLSIMIKSFKDSATEQPMAQSIKAKKACQKIPVVLNSQKETTSNTSSGVKNLTKKFQSFSTISDKNGDDETTHCQCLGASAMPETGSEKTTAVQNTGVMAEYRESIKKGSKFWVRVIYPPRHIYNNQTVMVDNYNRVIKRSGYMDDRTGVYKTPIGGMYVFDGGLHVTGEGSVRAYMCGGDGRREMLVDIYGKGDGWVCGDGHVHWDCPKDMTVWIEVEGNTRCNHTTRFTVGFHGRLED